MQNKGVVLVVSLVFMVILLTLTAAYFSGLIAEKKAMESERFILQALSFAEAGADHGLAEMRKRVREDLKTDIETTAKTVVAVKLANFFADQNPLGLLEEYCQFTVSGSQATFIVTPLSLNTGIQGSYSATIKVTPQTLPQNPTRPTNDNYRFFYNYSLSSNANITAWGIQKNIALVGGSFMIDVHLDNFAKYALFTSQHMTTSGGTVWFTANTSFNGPVATNTRFSFANNPSGHFTEEVTQLQSSARFYNNGSPLLLNADYNSTKDVPIFDKGFQRGSALINLPSSVTQNDLKTQALGGTSEPGSSGIYVPNDGISVTGGIYIRGNPGLSSDDAVISMSIDAQGNPAYGIGQGAAVKTITVDYQNNQTKVQSGSTTNTYQGIPDGVGNEGVIFYVNDTIKSLSGTVQKDSNLTVSSEKNIMITNNIVYEKDPTISGNENYANLLGVISWGGNVRIGTSAPNNVVVNGVIMAPTGVFTVDNYNSGLPRGTATLLGGAITQFYGAFGTFSGSTPVSGYGRNFVYDSRMLQGIAPPYFPYIGAFTSSDDGGLDNKLTWQGTGV